MPRHCPCSRSAGHGHCRRECRPERKPGKQPAVEKHGHADNTIPTTSKLCVGYAEVLFENGLLIKVGTEQERGLGEATHTEQFPLSVRCVGVLNF